MAKPFIDISILGDKQLEKALAGLPAALQKKALRPALRGQAKRIHGYITANLSGGKVQVQTGTWLRAHKSSARIRALKRSRTMMGYHVWYPERALLGIPPTAKWFYPAAVEYGYSSYKATVREFRVIRDAVDAHSGRDFPKIALHIRRGVNQYWSKRKTYK